MKAVIDNEQCMGCGNCIPYCPRHLLTLAETPNARGVYPVRSVDPSQCIGCGICEQMCTAAAIRTGPAGTGGYALIDRKNIPPHTGCYLGSLTKALADAICALHMEKEIVIFKKEASDINLLVETHDYLDEAYFEDGLRYKKEHPKRMVLIVCPSSKQPSTRRNEERLRQLKDTTVTLLHTSDWFESDGFDQKPRCGGTHVLEELKQNPEVVFAARGMATTPAQIRRLQSYIEQALRYQRAGRGFGIVEMVFPCFYRLSDRPQTLMPAAAVNGIRRWFEQQVLPDYEEGILTDRGE